MTRSSLRVVIDVNVWVAHAMAAYFGRGPGSAASRIIDIARSASMGERSAQVVISLEMIDNVERVLVRRGVSDAMARNVAASIIELVNAGPEELNPHLLLSGRDQLTALGREDAGVLATAIAAKASILITTNMKDFITNDGEVIETQMVKAGTGRRRLFAVAYERADDISLVVAHPVDVLDWLRDAVDITPTSIRRYHAKVRSE